MHGKPFLLVLTCILLSVLLLTACGQTPADSSALPGSSTGESEPEEASGASEAGETPESASSGENAESTSAEPQTSSEPSAQEPQPGSDLSARTLDEYLSAERYVTLSEKTKNGDVRYYIGKNGKPGGIVRAYSELTDHNVYSNAAGGGYKMVLEGDYRFLVEQNDWVYLLDTGGSWYRMPILGGEPELVYTLDADWKYSGFEWGFGLGFYGIYDDVLMVCDVEYAGAPENAPGGGSLRVLAHFLPTGETYELWQHDSAYLPVFWLLTNRSILYRTAMASEEEQMSDKGYYIYSGAEGKAYSIDLSKLPRSLDEIILDRDVEAVFPLDGDGSPVIGDFLTEVSLEEAGLPG